MTQRRATYRLQLTPAFGFDAAAGVVDVLADLGVSHLYLSPVLEAAQGSEHGYDVTDPTRVRAELGGEDSLARLVDACRRRDLALLLDIVPNHMATGDRGNRWWWDVLRCGHESPFAAVFDINWEHPSLRGRVIAPVLGDTPERVLAGGELRLVVDGGVVIGYAEHRLPLSPATLAEVLAPTPLQGAAEELAAAEFVEDRWRADERIVAALGDASAREAVERELDRWNGDAGHLAELLDRQHHRLAHWRDATAVLNYRRFFDITSLIGVRIEDGSVLEQTHRVVDRLLDSGSIDGVRIDHVDGLRIPRRYLQRMRRRHPGAWLLVEKILERDERMPGDWPVSGTTGYEFAAAVTGLLLEPADWAVLRDGWCRLTGEPADFDAVAVQARRDVIDQTLGPNVDRLVRLAAAIRRERDGDGAEPGEAALRNALDGLLVSMPVYRTYLRDAGAPAPEDRAVIETAFGGAEAMESADPGALGLLRDVLLGPRESRLERELVLRFQQASTVVMAKGVEDTAFYRWSPLGAVNDVGGAPAHPALDVAAFHDRNLETQRLRPETLLATSTHDSKRGEDVRARELALAEVAGEWLAALRRWRERHAEIASRVDPVMQLLLYETIVGAWPLDEERAAAYIDKAAHEAKRRTSWVRPDPEHDEALRAFVAAVYADAGFLAEAGEVAAGVTETGRVNSLAMALLRLTSPGVPDTYQGTELWSLSLVDPDNRRPVDWEARRTLLRRAASAEGAAAWQDSGSGLPKLHLMRVALDLRRRRPELFDARGAYSAMRAEGPRSDDLVVFSRGEPAGAITLAPRHGPRREGWEGTSLGLPAGTWRSLLDGATWSGEIGVDGLLARFPVALLEAA